MAQFFHVCANKETLCAHYFIICCTVRTTAIHKHDKACK